MTQDFEATLEAWQPFFAAELGAAAALGGLLFVSLSLNLTKILSYPALPIRALVALVLLLAVLVISSVALVPGQSEHALAIEIFIVAVAVWASVTAMDIHVFRTRALQSVPQYAVNMAILQIAAAPYVLGGLILLAGNPAGLYCLAVAVIASFVKAVIDAWVLLVEINR
ncbi:MAG: hypothetical protein ACJ8AS_11780 [Hyphomicrobiales bacterium]